MNELSKGHDRARFVDTGSHPGRPAGRPADPARGHRRPGRLHLPAHCRGRRRQPLRHRRSTHRMRRGLDFEPEVLFAVEGTQDADDHQGKDGPQRGRPGSGHPGARRARTAGADPDGRPGGGRPAAERRRGALELHPRAHRAIAVRGVPRVRRAQAHRPVRARVVRHRRLPPALPGRRDLRRGRRRPAARDREAAAAQGRDLAGNRDRRARAVVREQRARRPGPAVPALRAPTSTVRNDQGVAARAGGGARCAVPAAERAVRRADLELLDGGGRPRADDEPHPRAVPEPADRAAATTLWPGSTSTRCCRCANLLWGFTEDGAEPADGAPAGGRVHGTVRPAAGRPGRAAAVRRWWIGATQFLEGVPRAAARDAPSSTRSATTRPSTPTRSRC